MTINSNLYSNNYYTKYQFLLNNTIINNYYELFFNNLIAYSDESGFRMFF